MKKISFDFDGTLSQHFDGQLNPFENDVRNMIKRLINDGHDVHIVTRRYGNPMLTENRVVYEVAEILGLNRNNIHFTNREWKYKTINELGIEYHIDDDMTDIQYIKNYCENTKGFLLGNDGPEGFYKLIKN